MNSVILDLLNSKNSDINAVSEIVINTVKAKALYQKGGWELVRNSLKDSEFINPNFPLFTRTLLNKLRDNKVKFSFNITNNMQNIANEVNKYFNYKVVSYVVDRKAHFIKIII